MFGFGFGFGFGSIHDRMTDPTYVGQDLYTYQYPDTDTDDKKKKKNKTGGGGVQLKLVYRVHQYLRTVARPSIDQLGLRPTERVQLASKIANCLDNKINTFVMENSVYGEFSPDFKEVYISKNSRVPVTVPLDGLEK